MIIFYFIHIAYQGEAEFYLFERNISHPDDPSRQEQHYHELDRELILFDIHCIILGLTHGHVNLDIPLDPQDDVNKITKFKFP